MAHLDPLPREELPQYEALFERYDRIRGFLPNSILTMGRRPNIADAFMQLNQASTFTNHFDAALGLRKIGTFNVNYYADIRLVAQCVRSWVYFICPCYVLNLMGRWLNMLLLKRATNTV